jgi:hypothetical protein
MSQVEFNLGKKARYKYPELIFLSCDVLNNIDQTSKLTWIFSFEGWYYEKGTKKNIPCYYGIPEERKNWCNLWETYQLDNGGVLHAPRYLLEEIDYYE